MSGALFWNLGQCQALVSEPPHFFHSHRCKNQARVEVEGRRVCHIHRKIIERYGVGAQEFVAAAVPSVSAEPGET